MQAIFKIHDDEYSHAHKVMAVYDPVTGNLLAEERINKRKAVLLASKLLDTVLYDDDHEKGWWSPWGFIR